MGLISNQIHCSTCHNYCWLGAWGPWRSRNCEEDEKNKTQASIGQALENHDLSSGGPFDSWLSGWCSKDEFIWRTGDWCGAHETPEYLKKWAVIYNQKHCSTRHNYCWLGAWGPWRSRNREEDEKNTTQENVGQAQENHIMIFPGGEHLIAGHHVLK